MKATIDVQNRKEAELIRKGLAEPDCRAFVKIIGVLSGQSDRSKTRILSFVKDHFDEISDA